MAERTLSFPTPADSPQTIEVNAGDDIKFTDSAGNAVSAAVLIPDGKNLIAVLPTGETLILEGFFDHPDDPPEILSEDGSQVVFAGGYSFSPADGPSAFVPGSDPYGLGYEPVPFDTFGFPGGISFFDGFGSLDGPASGLNLGDRARWLYDLFPPATPDGPAAPIPVEDIIRFFFGPTPAVAPPIPNDPPTAVDDMVGAAMPQFTEDDGPVNLTATLLSNDTDPDPGDILSVSAAGGGLPGTLNFAGGTVTYNPSANPAFQSLVGTTTDTFTYTVRDSGGLTDTATVTVTIAGVNDAPVFSNLGNGGGNPLTAASEGPGAGQITVGEVEMLADAAIARWVDSGLSAGQLEALQNVTFSVADLAANHLGVFNGNHITIDDDAAGGGWFVDPTPFLDEEFTANGAGEALVANEGSAASSSFDLLTVLLHELGHGIGLPDLTAELTSGDIMATPIGHGSRRLPADGQAEGAVPGSIVGDAFNGGPPSTEESAITITSGNLVITDILGADTDDDLTLSISGTTLMIVDNNGNGIDLGAVSGTGDGTSMVTIDLGTGGWTGGIIVDSLGGDDTLTIDFGSGNFSRAVTFNGGAQAVGDQLNLTGGGTFANATYAFVNENDGSIDITGNSTITYTGLEPITSTITATDVTLNYSGAAETITVTDAGSGQTTVDSTAGESVTFNNPTNPFTINAGGGADTIDVNPLMVPFNVFGGDPAMAPGDTLNVLRPPGEVTTLTNAGSDDGTYTTTGGFGDIVFDEIETSRISNPLIGVAKDVTLDGNAVTFDFFLENFGNVEITTLSLPDNLDAVFGAGNFTITGVPAFVDDPGSIILNAGFDGSGQTNLISSGTLAAGDTAHIRVVATTGLGGGSFSNQVTLSGLAPGNTVLMDLSTAGVDPDPNGDGNPGEDDPTNFVLGEEPAIGVAKSASVTGNVVTLDFFLENLGNVDLSQLTLTENFDAVFGAGNYSITSVAGFIDNPGTITLNAGFDGSSDTALIVLPTPGGGGGRPGGGMSSGLTTGDTARIQLQVTVDNLTDQGLGLGIYDNQVLATAASAAGDATQDLSDNGVDPDPNGNGDPTEAGENDPTPIVIAEDPVIGVAKEVLLDTLGTFPSIQFVWRVENLGNVTLGTISLTDDMDAVFGAGNYIPFGSSSVSISGGGTINLNANHGTGGDFAVLAAGSTLDVESVATITSRTFLITNVTDQGSGVGVYQNQALAAAAGPSGGMTNDLSDAGNDADPNGNGDPTDPGEDDPNLFSVNSFIGAAKNASVTGNVVTLDLFLENFGGQSLSAVSLTDNLDSVFGAGNYTISSGPSLIDNPGTLTLNGGFDGSSDAELIATGGTLNSGHTAQIQFEVTVNQLINRGTSPTSSLGDYENQVFVSAQQPGGTTISDLSDAGTDPDPNGNAIPTETGENDPTPFTITSDAVVGAGKTASVVGQDVTLDLFLENLGTGTSSNLSLIDNLDAVFGAGNYTITGAPMLIAGPGTINLNGAYDGSGNDDILAAGSSLAAGDTAQIQLVVNSTNLGAFSNQAIVSGTDSAGVTVTDLSDDNADPDNVNSDGDPTAPGQPDPPIDGEDDPTGFIVGNNAIGAALNISVSGNTLTLDYRFENLGDVVLSDISVSDVLATTYGFGNFIATSGPTLIEGDGSLNGSFNQASFQIFSVNGTLDPGETATIRLVGDLTTFAGPYSHQFTVNAVDPLGNMITDLSDAGVVIDLNGNRNADETGENDPTIVVNGEEPVIGVAKDVNVSGNTVTLDYTVENLGNVAVSNLSMIDDLDVVFGAGNYSFTSISSVMMLGNASFDGSGDTELFGAGASLNAGATETIQIVLDVTNITNQGLGLGTYENQVAVTGDGPSGQAVQDISDFGTDPDPNGNNNPADAGESDPTRITVPVAAVGAAKNAAVDGNEVTLEFVIENLGTEALTNVNLAENLDTVLGVGNYTLLSGPTLVSPPRTLTLNGSFDGSTDTQLIGSGTIDAGFTERIQIVVRVDNEVDMGFGLGVYANQVTVSAEGATSGAMVTDLSDEGAEPDTNGNGNPADPDEGDPTFFSTGQIFVEGGSPIQLDDDVTISDVELDSFNGGNGDYHGASLMIQRNGGANAEDDFGFQTMPNVTVSGSDLLFGGNVIGTISELGGQFTVDFTNANGSTPTTALVNEILQGITYENTGGMPPSLVTLDYLFDDGNDSAAQGIDAQGIGPNLQAMGSLTIPIFMGADLIDGNESFDAISNVGINVNAANGLLSNTFGGSSPISIDDLDGTMDGTFTAMTTQGGTIVIDTATGAFTYLNEAGDSNIADTFTYTVRDNLGATDTSTVTLNLGDSIWFIDDDAGGGGDGTLTNPFDTLAAFNAVNNGAGNNPGAGENIFLFEGSYTGGISLLDNQQLIGQGVTGTTLENLLGITLPTFSNPLPTINGINPTISNAAGDGIDLASGNTIRGLNVGDSSDFGIDSNGATVGNLTISEVDIANTTGGGFRADNGGMLDVTFGSLTSTGSSAEGIDLSGVSGTFTVTTATISNSAEAGIDIDNSGGTFTFGNSSNISNTTGSAVNISNLLAGGDFDYNGSIVSNNNTIVSIDTTAPGSTIDFTNNGANSLTSTDNPLGAIFIFDADGNITITTPTTVLRPGFSSLFATDGDGIWTFSDLTITDQIGLNGGIDVFGQMGTVNFHNVNITTDSAGTGSAATGFLAGGNNIINLTGSNSVNADGGGALVLININEINMVFDSLTSTNNLNSQIGFAGDDGIDLLNIGSGTLNVTGTTTVRNADGVGISVENVGATVTFAMVDLDGIGDDAVISGVAFDNPGILNINGGTINDVGDDGLRFGASGFGTGTTANINDVAFTNIGGFTARIANSTVSGMGNTAVPFSSNDGGGNTGTISFNGGADTAPLFASSLGTGGEALDPADIGAITGVVNAATLNWLTSGLANSRILLLDGIEIEVADLPGAMLGGVNGSTIRIDVDAAGHGWFLDPTPLDSGEFSIDSATGNLEAIAGGPAAGQIDLLTVLHHEIGHVLGLGDLYAPANSDNLMYGFLDAGERKLPGDATLDLEGFLSEVAFRNPGSESTLTLSASDVLLVEPQSVDLDNLPAAPAPAQLESDGSPSNPADAQVLASSGSDADHSLEAAESLADAAEEEAAAQELAAAV